MTEEEIKIDIEIQRINIDYFKIMQQNKRTYMNG